MDPFRDFSELQFVGLPQDPIVYAVRDGKTDAGMVRTDTLERMLRERPGLRIGTDVWPEEPPSAHPLILAWKRQEPWLADRLILCPHTAFYSEQSLRELRAFAASIVKEVLSGGKPYNVVNGVSSEQRDHLLR